GDLADGDPSFRCAKSDYDKGARSRGPIRMNVDDLAGAIAGCELVVRNEKGVRARHSEQLRWRRSQFCNRFFKQVKSVAFSNQGPQDRELSRGLGLGSWPWFSSMTIWLINMPVRKCGLGLARHGAIVTCGP